MQGTRQLPLILIAVLLLGAGLTAGADEDISVNGGAESLWARRMLPNADGTQRWVFAYTQAGTSSLRIYSLPMRPSSGVIRQTAVRGRNYHVFFRDGAHFRFRPPLDPLAPAADGAASNDFPERVLPGKATPLALCGDEAREILYAVVKSRTAARIPPPPTTQPYEADGETNRATEREGPAPTQPTLTTAPTESPAPDASTNGPAPVAAPDVQPDSSQDDAEADDDVSPRYALVSYQVSYWRPEVAIPATFDEHASCWLAAHDGVVWLLYSLAAAPDEVRLTRWDGQVWSAPERIADLAPENLLAAVVHDGGLMLIVREPAGSDTYMARTRTLGSDGTWTIGSPLRLEDQEWTFEADEAAFGRLGDKLVGIWRDAGGEDAPETMYAARWSVEGGDPLAQPETVPALVTRQGTLANERTRMLAATLVLTVLLLIAFMRRRESFLTDLPVPPGFVLARLGKRFVAFLIDAAVIVSVTAPFLLVSWLKANNIGLGAPDVQSQIDYAMMQDREGFYWRWMIGVAVYVLYGVVFESIWAATLGKLALGLRVRNHRAERASFAAIVVRNVLRFEVYFLLQFAPIAVLVALTRNRQRLGDLVANTIVVEKV